MKGFAIAVVAFAVVTILLSCQRQEEPVFAPLSADEISGAALWERITEDYPYADYSYWPGHEGIKAGQAPHGALHRIYVNRTLLEGLPVADSVAPNGSIIVKDNLTASRELAVVTVMAKVQGYNPEAGDWFWARYGPDGSIQAEGKLNGCITCHEGVADNDYVIVRRLDEPLRD